MGYLRISNTQAKALEIIASVKPDKFREITLRLTKQINPSIRSSGLLSVVSEISNNQEFSIALCSQLISLATFRRVERMSSQEVVDGLIEGMKRAEFSQPTLKWFEDVQPQFLSLLECESIKLPAKALHLSTDFQQIYASANVVTDVRPVFDDDRSKIAGAIVTQTLRIKFLERGEPGGEREVSLALDSDDITKLIAELEKANQKAAHAKERFGEKTGADIFIIGEETYGFG